ncbi:MAG: hypothetical protein ACYTG6_06465 [Planctomycetota bacterium]|jgi:hypothetical protein
MCPAPEADRDPGMETPTAPLSDPGAPPPPASLEKDRRFFAPVKVGLWHALRAWRPLLCVVVVQLLLALTVAVPFQSRLAAKLDRHVHAPALAGTPDAHDVALGWEAGLDAGLWRDLERLEDPLLDGLAISLFWVAAVAWLFGALAAGGFLGTALDGSLTPSAGRFFAHGGRYFGRMLRVGIVFLVVIYLAARLVFELWGGVVKGPEETAATQSAAFWGARTREGVFLLFFLWMRVAADLARADLVVFSRRSAFFAFFRGVGRTLRRPLRTFGLALMVGVPAFAVLLLLGLAVQNITGRTWLPLLGTFLVLQLAVYVRWASRAALLAGDAHLVAALSRR